MMSKVCGGGQRLARDMRLMIRHSKARTKICSTLSSDCVEMYGLTIISVVLRLGNQDFVIAVPVITNRRAHLPRPSQVRNVFLKTQKHTPRSTLPRSSRT